MEKRDPSALERGLKWDAGFNRRLGAASIAASFGFAIIGNPVAAAKIALFAGANFAAAEISDRFARSFENKRTPR